MFIGAALTVLGWAPFLIGKSQKVKYHMPGLSLIFHFGSQNCLHVCRVLTELVSKMKDMQMDKTELGCLRAIVLFNPGGSPSETPITSECGHVPEQHLS